MSGHPRHEQARKPSAGIRIDSSLIHTATAGSSEMQHELSGLGVSVYSQEEFEEGLMRQIDQEVSRQNAEQDKKFLLKEYGSVKRDINAAHVELNNISKTIAGLLSKPLNDIVHRLRELRTSQEQKRQHLQQLKGREQQILDKLSGKKSGDRDGGNQDEQVEPVLRDVAFGIPLGGDREALIQQGLLTPFGSAVSSETPPSSLDHPTEEEHDSATPGEERSMAAQSSGLEVSSGARDLTGTQHNKLPTLPLGEGNEMSREKEGEDRRSSTPARIQLSSDSFNGLFGDLPTAPQAMRKGLGRGEGGEGKGGGKGVDKESKVLSKGKGKEKVGSRGRLEKTIDSMEVGGSHFELTSSPEEAAQETDSLGLFADEVSRNSSIRGASRCSDEYTPTPSDLEEREGSGSSEYTTDEELGGGIVKGRRNRKRTTRKLRDILSDESDDELIRTNTPKRRRSLRHGGRFQDDGDEELYRMRIRLYKERRKEEEEEGVEPDMVFEGGLRIPGSIWHKLYRYQQTGVKWLWELHGQQAGGIVGDEMGLGKTIQMIAFLAGLKVSQLRSHVTRQLGLGPVLIVCPATVMHQWVSEFHTWWAPFRVAVLHDTGTFSGQKKKLVQSIVKGNGMLITTYAGIRVYREDLLQHRWDYLVLDEGHKIRNPDAEITLTCKQFATPHRLILSGSPMQNNLRELWSLMDFVFAGKLGTLPVFMEQFSVPITIGGYANATQVQVETAYRCACVLRDTINPYLLRRLKADVKLQLPNKNEQVLFCRLSDYQREIYENFIKSPEVEAMLVGRGVVFSGLTTLRKLCNHPDLVTNDYSDLVRVGGAEEEEGGEDFVVLGGHQKKGRKRRRRVRSGRRGDGGEGEGGGEEEVENEEVFGHWRRSGKMAVVESLLKLWQPQGHKVLLFTQSKQMLGILENFVTSRGYSYLRMDGGTGISTRQPMINKFNEDPSIFVFLLTTRVGGLGINLTGADRVIIYDPDWNPSTDTQARERAWRIGQTRQVTIYRLLTSGTIEEKIYHRQIFKQFLTNRVLKDPRQRRFFKSNDLYELFTLGTSAQEGETETSAIFAGTGSQVVPTRKNKRSHDKSRDSDRSKRKKKRRTRVQLSRDQSTTNALVENLPAPVSPVTMETESGENSLEVGPLESTKETPGMEPGPSHSSGVELGQPTTTHVESSASSGTTPFGMEPGLLPDERPVDPELIHSSKHKKERKRFSKRRKRPTQVEYAEISGLDKTCVYQPGDGDEAGASEKQDHQILRKLFKKAAVHTAMQHDTIMSSAEPDYVLVESEASRVAQSAAKALKDSRRRCLAGRQWGQPTWTGQHGLTGAPGRRFGSRNSAMIGLSHNKQGSSYPDGLTAGTTPTTTPSPSSSSSSSSSKPKTQGSLVTSSSHLLSKMRARNAHALPEGGPPTGLHQRSHGDLLKDVRDFIATRCRVDGQATTEEILGKFAVGLPAANTAVFRSMLHEICDFSRHRGEGLWILKPEFR